MESSWTRDLTHVSCIGRWVLIHCAAAKSLQWCLTLCDPTDGSPQGSHIPGILQARTLKWVAISFSNAWKWKVKVKLLSCVWLLATPWTAAHQAPPSMGFSRQEYWSGMPLPSPLIHCTTREVQSVGFWQGCQNYSLWERIFFSKTGNRTALWSSNPTAGHTHWENQKGKRHVYTNVHRSTVYNSQDMEAT